ncbi:MAG TPA: hypothetical protein VGS07_21745 [Thermoanaerobaculia bacterium]|nr:hypothetical protein [Thermoanaerobaculia bacterium]
MSRCDRFEEEGLLLLEQGLPLDEHFATCPDCLAAQDAYERLRAELAALGAEDEPPVGWQARVWERLDDHRERRERRRPRWPEWRGWVVPVGVGLAASLAALFLIRPPGPQPPSLRVEVEAGATVRRGGEAQPGDLLRLTAATGGAGHAELRVYRNDTELVLRCSTDRPCTRRGDELRAAVLLDAVGRYQPLLMRAEGPLPPPVSNLEKDTSAALAAGADVRLGSEIVVR